MMYFCIFVFVNDLLPSSRNKDAHNHKMHFAMAAAVGAMTHKPMGAVGVECLWFASIDLPSKETG